MELWQGILIGLGVFIALAYLAIGVIWAIFLYVTTYRIGGARWYHFLGVVLFFPAAVVIGTIWAGIQKLLGVEYE
jgi:hypothetical protein